MKNNLNIAFCFFGQVRFFEVIEIYRNWRNYDPNVNIDMFISTWSDFPYENEFEDFISINMIDVNDNSWNNFNTDYCLSSHTSLVTPIYHIIEVNKLRRDYELKNKFKYDYVMFVRTDWLLSEQKFFESVFEFKTTDLIIVSPIKKLPNFSELYTTSHDYVWMGSPEVIDIFIKEIYNTLELYAYGRNNKGSIPQPVWHPSFTDAGNLFRHKGHSFWGTMIKRSKLPINHSSWRGKWSGLSGLIVRGHSDLGVFKKYPDISSDELIKKILVNREDTDNWKYKSGPAAYKVSKWKLKNG
jgi:hypothetical protein